MVALEEPKLILDNSYVNSTQKHMGRVAMIAQYKEHSEVTSREEIFYGGLPGELWEFEKELANSMLDSPKKLKYRGYEIDPKIFKKIEFMSQWVDVTGSTEALMKLNPSYTKGNIFRKIKPCNVLWIDLLGGYTQKTLDQIRKLVASMDGDLDLLYITMASYWRSKREDKSSLPKETAVYSDFMDAAYPDMPKTKKNIEVMRTVLPMYIDRPVAPIFDYTYKNDTKDRSWLMWTTGYNLSSLPITKTFFASNVNKYQELSYDQIYGRTKLIGTSVAPRITDATLVGV
jgi:hypothetical protein